MHEIIHVVEPESLARTGRQGLEIEAVNDRPLAAGYYFVLLTTNARSPHTRAKRYFGPFATVAQARLLQRTALALGLVQPGEGIQSIAECRSIVRRPVLPRAPGFTGSNSLWHQEANVRAAP